MTLASLLVKIGADNSELTKAVSSSQAALDKFAGSATQLGKTLSLGLTAPIVAGATALGVMATKSIETAGNLVDLSNKTGLSIEALQQLKFITSQAGGSVESFANANIQLARRLGEGANASKDVKDTLAALGLSITELTNGSLTQEEVFFRVTSALGGMKGANEQTAAAMALFGRGGVELLPVIRDTGGQLDVMRQQANDLGIVMSGDSVKALEGMGDKMEAAKLQMASMGNQISVALIPLLQQLIPVITNDVVPAIVSIAGHIAGVIKAFTDLPQPVQTGILAIVGIAAAAGPVLAFVGTIVGAFSQFSGAISGAMTIFKALGTLMLTNPFVALAAAVVAIAILIYKNWDEIQAALGAAWQAIASTAQTFWNGIVELFSGIWAGIATATQAAWNGIVAFLQGIWNAIGPIVSAGWQNIASIFTAHFETISAIVQAVWETIKTIFATAILVIIDLVTGRWDEIGQVFQAAGEKLRSIVSGLWDEVKSIWSGAFLAIVANTSAAWTQVETLFVDTWNNLVAVVSNLWDDVKQWFANAGESIKATVVNMWNDVVSFFQQAPGRIVQALSSLGQALTNAWDQFKVDALNAGINLVRGFINGVWSLAQWVEQQIGNFFNSVVQWAKRVLGIASPSIVFDQIGADLMAGLAQGIANGVTAVVNAAKNMSTEVINKVKSFFNMNSPSLVFAEMGDDLMAGLAMGITRSAELPVAAINLMAERTKLAHETMVAASSDAVAKIGNNMGQLADRTKQITDTIAQGVANMITGLTSMLVDFASGTADASQNIVQAFVLMAVGVVESVIKQLLALEALAFAQALLEGGMGNIAKLIALMAAAVAIGVIAKKLRSDAQASASMSSAASTSASAASPATSASATSPAASALFGPAASSSIPVASSQQNMTLIMELDGRQISEKTIEYMPGILRLKGVSV